MNEEKNGSAWALKYIAQQLASGFYGAIRIICEAGKIKMIKEEKTIKPPK